MCHGEIRRGVQIVILVPRLRTRPQELSSLGTVSLTDCAQCIRMSSINMSSIDMSNVDMGLDYDSTVMLICKLLFAAAKAIVDVGPHIHIPRQS